MASVLLAGATIVDPCAGVVVGDTCTLTATPTGYASPEYRFQLKPPGGSFVVVQDWSADATVAWDTTGLARGQYVWQVEARESVGGSDSYDTLYLDVWPATRLPDGLVDDQAMLVTSDATMIAKRAEVAAYLWGSAGMPTGYPTVTKGVAPPISNIDNVTRVDQLDCTCTMVSDEDAEIEVTQRGFLFVPASDPRGVTVLVHNGHSFAPNDSQAITDVGNGFWRTVNLLTRAGYTVALLYMPEYIPGDGAAPESWVPADPSCETAHKWLKTHVPWSASSGHWARAWLELAVRTINYCADQWVAGELPQTAWFGMSGWSGGGTITTWLSALDTRIWRSMPVAGSVPGYAIFEGSKGCEIGWAQDLFEVDETQLVGWLDLYAMSASVTRRSVWSLNRADPTAFGEAQYSNDVADGVGERLTGLTWEQAMRDAEANVQAVVGVRFALRIDEDAVAHQITWGAARALLALLDEDKTMGTMTTAGRNAWLDAGNAIFDGGSVKAYDASDTSAAVWPTRPRRACRYAPKSTRLARRSYST